MNDAPDKRFHDWVRQTLRDSPPEPDPAGWERLRGTRRWRRWRGVAAGALGLLLVGVGGWLGEIQHPDGPGRVPAGRVTGTPASALRETPVAGVGGKVPPSSNEPTGRRSSVRRAPVPVRPVPVLPERVPSTPEPIRPRFPQPPATDWSERLARVPLVVPGADEIQIQQQLLTGKFGPDSTSYRVLSRNLRRWPDAVVVCDLTSSMAPYTTQLYAWFRRNARNPAIRGLVLFTDCDSLGQETRPGGPPGQFFVTRERDPLRALPTLLAATRHTRANVEDPENDVEALRFAQQAFPEAKHLILLADNSSPVKDLDRLDGLQKPVHVVLCGPPLDSAVAYPPDYETLARQTRGSLHTLEDDLDPARLGAGTWLRVGPRFYRYDARRERFRLTRFRHRPSRLLGLFWW